MKIGYRVWCRNKKEWEADPTLISPIGVAFDLNRRQNRLVLLDEKTHIVELSTGIHDKNGVEIFEGDCVRFEVHDGATVVWNCTSACFEFKAIKYYCETDISQPCEVVGNIHENTELL